jgi:hypothetical protein
LEFIHPESHLFHHKSHVTRTKRHSPR